MKISLGLILGPLALGLAMLVLVQAGGHWLPPMDRFGFAGFSIAILRDMMAWFPWVFFIAVLLIGLIVAVAKRGLH